MHAIKLAVMVLVASSFVGLSALAAKAFGPNECECLDTLAWLLIGKTSKNLAGQYQWKGTGKVDVSCDTNEGGNAGCKFCSYSALYEWNPQLNQYVNPQFSTTSVSASLDCNQVNETDVAVNWVPLFFGVE